MHYFAYGTNMDLEDLARYCAEKRFPTPELANEQIAYLPRHQMVFNHFLAARLCGGANLKETGKETDRVWGALYEVKEPYFKILDLKEGAPKAYERRPVTVVTNEGRVLKNVMTYTARPERVMDQHVPPKWGYLMLIVKIGRRLGFPEEYLKQLEAVTTADTR